MNLAARDGDLEFIEWVHGHGDRFPVVIDPMAMNFAAENGHLNVLKKLMQKAPDTYSSKALDCAARRGHTDIMDWLVENVEKEEDPVVDPSPDSVLKSGPITVVKWVIENNRLSMLDKVEPLDAVKQAADNGHWEMLKYICTRGISGYSRLVSEMTIKKGNLDMVRFDG